MAEVLQSAEAMKAAVSHLEKFMEKKSDSRKGKVILATVKGDVHDIGKNLVEIILSNNGYEVVNLGIKVPPERLIEAYREHRPDLIGLSGLLVKSAQQMVATAKDLAASGVEAPMLVGGAALSQKFTDSQDRARLRRPRRLRRRTRCAASRSPTGSSREQRRGRHWRRKRRSAGVPWRPRRRPIPRRRTRWRRRRCAARTSRSSSLSPRRISSSTSSRTSTPRRSGSTSIPTCSTPSTWACAGATGS